MQDELKERAAYRAAGGNVYDREGPFYSKIQRRLNEKAHRLDMADRSGISEGEALALASGGAAYHWHTGRYLGPAHRVLADPARYMFPGEERDRIEVRRQPLPGDEVYGRPWRYF